MEKAGDVNPLLEAANKIGDENQQSDEQTAQQQPGVVDPQPGTYERFMSSFGSPQRWAGRS